MLPIRILWIDLRVQGTGPGLADLVPERHEINVIEHAEAVPDRVPTAHPDLACFEFDCPDEAHLQALPRIRRAFPPLPLLLFTEYHSEALAVRAFRSGVQDYRVKPVSAAMLTRSIEFAAGMSEQRGEPHGRSPAMPPDLAALGWHMQVPVATTVKTAAAVAYVTTHYAQPVSGEAAAARCHLSASAFRRTFRREHERTFGRFVVEFRIGKARELLLGSPLTITQVAHATGFNDSSYFTRAFRRVVGVSASDWRHRAQATRQTTGT